MGRKKKEDLNKPIGKDDFEIKVNEFGSVISSFSVDKLNNLLNKKAKAEAEAEKNKTTPSESKDEKSGDNTKAA